MMSLLPFRAHRSLARSSGHPRWPLAMALAIVAGCGAATYEERLEATRRDWTEAAGKAVPVEPMPDEAERE